MDKEWMGRYKELVGALVMHVNVVYKGVATKIDVGDGIVLTPQEWQTLDFLVYHDDTNYSMADVSRALGIAPSSFTRIVKSLKDYNLIERFQVSYNKKNVIIKPTEYGLDLYSRVDNTNRKAMFQRFFEDLEVFSDDDLKVMTNALNHLTQSLPSYKAEFTKID